jgi:hypothetical protein
MVARRQKPAIPYERDVLKACLLTLKLLGVHAERQNTGAVTMRDAKGGRRFVRFGTAGNLDIRGIIDGKPLEIEIKRPGKRPTTLQYNRMREIQALGGIAFWVDNAKDLEAIVRGIRAGCTVRIDERGDSVLRGGA